MNANHHTALIKERSGLSDRYAGMAAQLSTPVISQVFTTSLHLLGLSIYNHPHDGVGRHVETLKATYPPTVLLRMLRIIPAFSCGGVLNTALRQRWHAAC